MNPVRFNINEPVSLLQEQNIGYNLCPGIAFEGITRKSDCSEKLRPLSDIFTNIGVFLIHRSFACYKSHHTAGA